jgi:hypothetical protein
MRFGLAAGGFYRLASARHLIEKRGHFSGSRAGLASLEKRRRPRKVRAPRGARSGFEGFVTLSTAGAGVGDAVASCRYADSLAPCGEGGSLEFWIRPCGDEMAAGGEHVVDGGANGQEALRGPG